MRSFLQIVVIVALLFFLSYSRISATSLPLDQTFDYGVNAQDIKETIRQYGHIGPAGVLPSDVSADGKVNQVDVGLFPRHLSPPAINWWPQELGNYWTYEVTEFDSAEFALWEQNFRGLRTGVGQRDCSGTFGDYKRTTLGTKLAMTINPSMGYNRFYTGRFLQFYKESPAAYHAPQYCDMTLRADGQNSWNLQWYTHHPFYFKNQYWYGSEGGVWFQRAVRDGRATSDSTLLEKNAEISVFGLFPKNQGWHVGGGRYPAVDFSWHSLLGYTYIPLNQLLTIPNSTSEVVPDVSYEFGVGSISDASEFRTAINSYLNDYRYNKLIWDLEYLPLKARDVLTKNAIPGDTDVLSVMFFEPLYRDLTQTILPEKEEMACENWYFAKNIGLVKVSHSIVAVLPNDPFLSNTRQLCFWIFRDDFIHSTDLATRDTDFRSLSPYISDIAQFVYSYPVNSFELTASKRYKNPNSDALGFHSPGAASLVNYPEANSLELFANGRFWVYTPDGKLWTEGSLFDVWKNNSIVGHSIVYKGQSLTVYPWTDDGPDAVENGPDVVSLFGTQGIVINNGVYWLRNPGTPTPFAGASGYLRDLLPDYSGVFGDDTDEIGVSGTGNGQLLVTKNGLYLLYGKSGNSLVKMASGKIFELPKWSEAPRISGRLPVTPDTLFYGKVFNETFNVSPTKADNPILSLQQLVVFQKGAVWTKFGVDGGWEDWHPFPSTPPFPTPSASPLASPPASVLTTLQSYDETRGDTTSNNRPKQTVVSPDGTILYTRTFDNNQWQNWNPISVTSLGVSGITKISAFDQSPAIDGTPRQTLISADGSLFYTRLFQNNSWGTWTSNSISSLGITGVTAVSGFDQTPGDSATTHRPKQTVVSRDGATLYTRFYDNGGWGAWSPITVGNLGIEGITKVLSFNQSLSPQDIPHQQLLADDGYIYYRSFSGDTWTKWSRFSVATLGILP